MPAPNTMTERPCVHCAAPLVEDEQICRVCGFEHKPGEETWLVSPGGLRPSGQFPVPPEQLASPPRPGGGRFDRRYELNGELGRGGMGIVYRAFDRELDEMIALKALPPACRDDAEIVSRFKHEIKVARKLSHPRVARLHDLVEIDGQLFLSMQLIEGRSLRDVILDEGKVPGDRVLRYLRALLPALDLAHELGIVHCDLKPSNVVVDQDDMPHILDFGIARSRWLDSIGDDTQPSGTPAYMAPEQWVNPAAIDARADLYSLGIMTYEMLTGKRPFEHKNRLLLMEMHRTRTPRRPSELVSGIPQALESLVLKLLEKSADRRPARARDVLQALGPGPESAPRVAGRSREARPPVARAPGSRGRVLIADDDPLVRKILAAQLREHDLVVIEAADGGEAVDRAFREIPDLILLDLRMPVLDGLEALRLVKNDPRTRDIPVVVMSGHNDREVIAFSRENGAATFLDKPVPSHVLDLVLERYVG